MTSASRRQPFSPAKVTHPQEAALVLGIALPTAKEWWSHARAWLAVEIRETKNAANYAPSPNI